MTTPAAENLFTTETAGLPEVASPGVLLLHDGDRLNLRIAPVRKRPRRRQAADARLQRVGYHRTGNQRWRCRGDRGWHGPRLDIRYDGIPDETRAPIPVGGIFTHQLRFPDAGF
jgi:hypothetical protein